MVTLWHDLTNYVWEVLFVVGVILGAILWLGMAAWDAVRGLFRRLSGEMDGSGGPNREQR